MQHFLPQSFAPFRCKQVLICLLASFVFIPLLMQAQPKLVKDIYPNQNQGTGEPVGSNLWDFINVNNTVYFIGEDGTSGQTLWKTDGTPQGTKKVAPGKIFGVYNLINVSGTLYFISSGGTGTELWKTDGTEEGTVKVAPGKVSDIRGLTNVNSTLFFTDNNSQLWRSDGTSQGTAKINVTFSGPLFEFNKVGNSVFFFTNNYEKRYNELWKSDGTTQGTVKISEGWINSYNSYSYNNKLFFVAYNQVTGRNDFWKSDGTETGTVKIFPNTFSYVSALKEAIGDLYFVAGDPLTGLEDLWKTDGTEEGTVKVAPGKMNRPSNFEPMNNYLYFTANDNTTFYPEIWRTDGTEQGTIKVAPDKAYFANSLTNINGTLYFTAYDPAANGSGYELWKSDGTTEGTILVKDLIPGIRSSSPRNFTYLNGNVVFSTYDSEGSHHEELWLTNGTEQGTIPINTGLLSSQPAKLTSVNNKLFFTSYTPLYGEELWISDGTDAGTALVKDITSGVESSSISQMVKFGNYLFFLTYQSGTGYRLWKSDGTVQGTSLVIPEILFVIDALTTVNNNLFLVINGSRLYKINETQDGVVPLSPAMQSPQNLINVNGILFYTTSNYQNNTVELWKSDGTVQGTVFVSTMPVSQEYNMISNLVSVNNTLFFTISNISTGDSKLWKSNGTAEGTAFVKYIHFNPYEVYKMNPVNVNGTLFFSAKMPNEFYYELWKSDGTQEGTIGVTPEKIYNPENLTAVKGTLFFQAFDFMYGTQLWKSDGSESGTVKVAPGKLLFGAPSPQYVELNNKLIFSSTDLSNSIGEELWQTDGTPDGTVLIKDINNGRGFSNPDNFTNVNGKLFFVADDGITGRELWMYDPAICIPINNANITINNVSVCEGNNATLSINNSQSGVLYKPILNGSLVFGRSLYPFGEPVAGGGNVSLTLLTADLEPGTYTIELYAVGCSEQKLPNPVTITVNALPVAPTAEPITIYSGEQATPKVTNAPVGATFKWYTQATGGTPISGATSATYVTPVLTASATYYVAAVDECGESERTAITVTVIGSPCTASGTILREVWEEVPGTSLNIVPFHTAPSLQSQLTLFEAPSNAGSNYGQRIRGYICPPQSGNYTFWIAGDDNCELWLSTNDDPDTKTRIAYITGTNAWTGIRIWDKYSSQRSVPVYLQAGQKYYIEALHKEGTGADNLAVGWQLPDSTMERPISGQRLSPYVPYGKGTLVKETWANVMGNSVSQIPLQTAATTIGEITSFEAPSNIANNYGQRIRGYVHPPVSGDYTFWLSGDDNCELWLSTSDDPATKNRIAYISGAAGWTYSREWNRFSRQQSVKVTLVAGRKYYVEVLHKESLGSDHVAVGWQLPDYSLERPVPGIRLSPFAFDGQERIAVEQGAQTNRFSLELYPNPSLGEKVFIQSKGLVASEKVEIILYNGVGNVILTHSLQADESGGLFDEIPFIHKLPAGMYTLMLQSASQTSTRKLVITR